jgi:predicted DNA-binding protein YlxM (UPF0122 family)
VAYGAYSRRGTKLGHKPSLSDNQRKHVRELFERRVSWLAVAKLFNVCRAMLYDSLKNDLPSNKYVYVNDKKLAKTNNSLIVLNCLCFIDF